jgi:methylenetetrahydrofolate reductase (NADPH)
VSTTHHNISTTFSLLSHLLHEPVLTATRIITPTIIEAVSFRAWIEEAFGIWKEWQHIYPARSATAKLMGEIREGYWLVNIIHHGYVEKDALWKLLLE